MRAFMLSILALAGCSDECFIDGLGCEDDIVPRVYTAVAAGADHTCARADTALQCWGDGPAPPRGGNVLRAAGEITCGLDQPSGMLACAYPGSSIYYPSDFFVDVAVSETHGCGIRRLGDGTHRLTCWDDPTPPLGTVSESVAVGNGHTCALRGGAASCWGRNESGQASPPPQVLDKLAASDGYTCALDQSAIVCWGLAPSPIPAGSFVEIAAGKSFACALRTDQTIACWGDPLDGRTSPPSGAFTTLAVGGRHGCAIDVAGGLACWGADDVGQSSPN